MYNTTEKMKSKYLNSKAIQKLIFTALQSMDASIPETLPNHLIKQYNLLDLYTSPHQCSFPPKYANTRTSTNAFKIRGIVYIQLSILRQANGLKAKNIKDIDSPSSVNISILSTTTACLSNLLLPKKKC